jgi:hypothetical protein
MSTLQRFLAYAADFEKTFSDDDWSRLEPYFSDDAVYRVESDSFGAELKGPVAIFRGIKKSLDGFDRKFTTREIAIAGEPRVEGNELRAAWTVTYTKDAHLPFVLRGKSFARVRGDRIELLVDSYDERVSGELAEWLREARMQVDPSYA